MFRTLQLLILLRETYMSVYVDIRGYMDMPPTKVCLRPKLCLKLSNIASLLSLYSERIQQHIKQPHRTTPSSTMPSSVMASSVKASSTRAIKEEPPAFLQGVHQIIHTHTQVHTHTSRHTQHTHPLTHSPTQTLTLTGSPRNQLLLHNNNNNNKYRKSNQSNTSNQSTTQRNLP